MLAALIGTLLTVQPARAAQTSQEANPVVIYMFWGDGCPHCAKAKPFLEELAARNPNVELRFYEIYNIVANRELFERMGTAHDYEPRGVPAIYIADQHWEGWSDAVGAQIEEVV
ncbi:MAG TPA: hypothetical protein DCZ08_12005, partial [Anaerolineaceae bacterium]|nr:hypothetical protein [Anaerolineaceae bacterium]